MVETYINGNFETFRRLYHELNKDIGWLGKIAGAFLAMMLIGNNAGVLRTPEAERTVRPPSQAVAAEEQVQSGGMRR